MITSKDFETSAKLLVMGRLIDVLGMDFITIDDIQLVWFAHVLGNKKAILITTKQTDQFVFEVTYNDAKAEFYIDTYDKIDNATLSEYAADAYRRIFSKGVYKKFL